jgi:beta-phosphoglucomutase
MSHPRAVLWDLDGTLGDSRDYHWRAWRETMAGEGVTITEAQFLASFGQRNDAILTQWLGREAGPERLAAVGEAKEVRYRRLVAEGGLAPLPGAAEWVRRLYEEGWLQAIASSAPRANVDVMLEALGFRPFLHATVSAEDVTHGKPDPEVFLTAADRVGAPPARCIVVEDAEAGVEAARRAGMRSIGVGDALGAADITVESLLQLAPDAFERLVR